MNKFLYVLTLSGLLIPCLSFGKQERAPALPIVQPVVKNEAATTYRKKPVQDTSWASRMAKTVMVTLWKDKDGVAGRPEKWSYNQGIVLKGAEGLWKNTGDRRYFDYIQRSMDHFVENGGTIRTYDSGAYDMDNMPGGRNLLTLYKVTGKEKYFRAATVLRNQLRTQPRIQEGGFWHKQKYSNQLWLDDLYFGQPFYAEYAATFHEDTAFNDIARQFLLMERVCRDARTGLLYHGYDASRTQAWANKTTGRSPHVWARAMGWYGMGLVDALEWFPIGHPARDTLTKILNRFAVAISAYQDKKSGLWWNIVDLPGKNKNYEEASASGMFVYTLCKGVRLGYLPSKFITVARKGHSGIINKFVKTESGMVNLYGTAGASGTGDEAYRNGDLDDYSSEKVTVNNPVGVGAFLMACNEMDMLLTLDRGKGKTVLLDHYFNSERLKDITGTEVPFHYVWEEMDNNGYSLLGHVFKKYGVATRTLHEAPTATNLRGVDIYLIVDPDTTRENPNPNYIEQEHINTIYEWVSKGGVLLMFANDPPNVEMTHFNRLTSRFGIQLNTKSRNMVKGDEYLTGTIEVPEGNSIFKTARKVYLKEICTLSNSGTAKAILSDQGDVIISVAVIGKGTVFVVGDPWLYNEYIDGRKLPAEFDNYKAAEDLVKWAAALK
ncbi:MAG: glycoside hydrolase family 88 protein [Chitinophagaceae bacterium]|nr:glycoside hydrolase family 88 protein [Chitinophagaceae bacterium]